MVKLFTLLWMAALCMPTAMAQSIAQTSSETGLHALLTEMRQMRRALETAATVAPRMQVILQRMQIQQQAVSRASEEWEGARSRLSRYRNAAAHRAQQIAHLEAKSAQESDPGQRKAMENEVKGLKALGDAHWAEDSEAALLSEEALTKGRLQIEEGNMRELNEKLNALDRMLELLAHKPQR